MRDAFIVGVGQTPVGEHWDRGLRELGAEAVRAALDDAGFETAGALYVGNMLGGCVNGQENVFPWLKASRANGQHRVFQHRFRIFEGRRQPAFICT